MSKLGQINNFLSLVSCDSLVLQGLRCEWGAGVLNLVLSLSLSHTGHWKFNIAPHGKELNGSEKNNCCSTSAVVNPRPVTNPNASHHACLMY